MSKIYAFYNPFAANGGCREDVSLLELLYDEEIIRCDMTRSETYASLLFTPTAEDKLILCGGDGTAHRFVNLVQGAPIPCDILLFPLGTRNNFARSLHHCFGDAPFSVKEALLRCPSITLNGQSRRFLWGVEFVWEGGRFQKPAAQIMADCGNYRFRQKNLTVTRQKGCLSLLRGPKCKAALTGQQMTFTFDRPVTVLADGEVLGQTASCRLALQ